MQRPITPLPQYAYLVTGHFRETVNYTNWRPHGTSDWLLIYTVSGTGRFGGPNGEQIVHAGDLTLLKPGTPHDYATYTSSTDTSGEANWELLWAHFHPRADWLSLLDLPEKSPGLMVISLQNDHLSQEKIVDSLWEMHRFAIGGSAQREAFAMNRLENALLWLQSVHPHSASSRQERRVRAAVDFLCSNLHKPEIDIKAAAKSVDLSSSRLAHLFKTQTGMTPVQFLERERIARACLLLDRTARPIQAIAANVGYENPFYFSLRFKRQTGFSPRDWRTRNDRLLPQIEIGEGDMPVAGER